MSSCACFRNASVDKLGGGSFMLVKESLAPVEVTIVGSLIDNQTFNIVACNRTFAK